MAWVRLTRCECSGLCETERVWVWGRETETTSDGGVGEAERVRGRATVAWVRLTW